MKKINLSLLSIFSLLFLCSHLLSGQNPPATPSTPGSQAPKYLPYLKTITEDDLKKHLYIYASDSMQGRGTGEEGQIKAINYLQSFYQSAHINSSKKNNDYLQSFSIVEGSFPQYTIKINEQYAAATTVYSYYHFPTFTSQIDTLVYVNYGIDTNKYNDYENLNVKGKAVLARFGEPKNENNLYLLSGTIEKSKYSKDIYSLYLKISAAKKQGAKALFVYSDFSKDPMQWGKYKYKDLFEIYKKVRYGNFQSHAAARTSLDIDIDLPVFFVNKEFLEKIKTPALANLKTGTNIPVKIDVDYKNEAKRIPTANVLAFIPGTEKPEEIVVISAHLDHLGKKDSVVYYGADDNGSGTVAMLEMAEAFQKAKNEGVGPKRSILFLHLTAEEMGLVGSNYYIENPMFPLANTVANLNIDMIGRTQPGRLNKEKENYIYVIGSDKKSNELKELSERVNQELGLLTLDYSYDNPSDPNKFFYRSDHYNFAKNKIPVIFYFSGTHPDYHKPTDTPEKIRYDLLKKRTQLIFATAWEIANRKERLK